MSTSTVSPESGLRAWLFRFEPLINAVAVAIMATIFLYWDLSRAMFVLLSLAALVLVVKYRPRMPADHRLYTWPIIAFVGANFLSLAVDGFSDSGVNRLVSRFFLLLIAIPLVSLFYYSYDSRRNPWIRYVVGCLVLGVLAIIDILYFDLARAGSTENESAFGFIALAMTSVAAASFYRFRRIRYGTIVYFLAIAMGFCAMILSGTRTSWIGAIPVLVVAMFFYFERYSLARRMLFTLAIVVGVTVAGNMIPVVEKRVDLMVEMAAPYVTGKKQSGFNSLRYRVELWKLGWNVSLAAIIYSVIKLIELLE